MREWIFARSLTPCTCIAFWSSCTSSLRSSVFPLLRDWTAALATTLHTALSNARNGVTTALSNSANKLIARDTALGVFRRRFRGTVHELEELLEDTVAGDPVSGLKWTHRSLRKLRKALRRRGIRLALSTVARLLRRPPHARIMIAPRSPFVRSCPSYGPF